MKMNLIRAKNISLGYRVYQRVSNLASSSSNQHFQWCSLQHISHCRHSRIVHFHHTNSQSLDEYSVQVQLLKAILAWKTLFLWQGKNIFKVTWNTWNDWDVRFAKSCICKIKFTLKRGEVPSLETIDQLSVTRAFPVATCNFLREQLWHLDYF